MSPRLTALAALLLACASAPTLAQPSVCSSDGQPRPVALLERFINADCDECWRDPKTPKAGRGELALDWILPGRLGDDAPLAMGASRDGLARLEALRRASVQGADAVRSRIVGTRARLRVAQGMAINDYIGTSIEVKPGTGRWQAWLLLVEQVPAGAEGSPVARNLVRNAYLPPWDGTRPRTAKERLGLYENMAMRIAEGAQLSRLRLVGLLYDEQGRLVSAVRSDCKPG